jgi:hypothetical protein
MSANKANTKERQQSSKNPSFYSDTDAEQVREDVAEQLEGEDDAEAPYGRMADGSPITRPRQRDREPQYAADPASATMARSEINNPRPQFVQPGQEPMGRNEIVRRTGELDPLLGMTIEDAAKKIEDERAAFLYWQSGQEDFYIHENMGYDKKTGRDKWVAKPHQVYKLTMAQYQVILDADAEVQDMFLLRNIRDIEFIKQGPNKKINAANNNAYRIRCKLWFRMTDEEINRSHWPDVRDMCDAAQLNMTKVPQSRKGPTIGP